MRDHQRVMVGDDHPIALRILRAKLGRPFWADDVLGNTAAVDGVQEAVTQPMHVVAMDVGIPDRDGPGIEATVRVLRVLPNVVVPVRTMDGGQDIVARAMGVGANGFVLKDLGPDELMSSLRATAGGARGVRDGRAERRAVRSDR
jgi:DNA-binding NarL/FixJ family response regulator